MWRPTASLADSSGARSGWRAALIGVGTATMMKSACSQIRRALAWRCSCLAAISSAVRDLAGGVDLVLQVLDAALGEVVADGGPALAERHRHRQADVAQADDGTVAAPIFPRPGARLFRELLQTLADLPLLAAATIRDVPVHGASPARPSGARSAGSRAGAAPCRCRRFESWMSPRRGARCTARTVFRCGRRFAEHRADGLEQLGERGNLAVRHVVGLVDAPRRPRSSRRAGSSAPRCRRGRSRARSSRRH